MDKNLYPRPRGECDGNKAAAAADEDDDVAIKDEDEDDDDDNDDDDDEGSDNGEIGEARPSDDMDAILRFTL